MTAYLDFIQSKQINFHDYGFEIDKQLIHNQLYDFQADIVQWALKKGKAAIFADCGLGKTIMQLEWARHIYNRTGKPILIVAPLAVTQQTKREGAKIGVEVNICRHRNDVRDGINITNYEMLEHFNAEDFIGAVLDECFPPDTPIDVFNIDNQLAKKCIKDIQRDDLIYNANGVDNVKEIRKRQINRAVQICYRGKRITCSENHPFFTLHGWRCAKDLQPGDYLVATARAVRLVRGNLQAEIYINKNEQVLRDILLGEMEDEYSGAQREGAQSRSGEEAGYCKVEMVEVLEQGHPELEKYRDAEGFIYFYDIEAKRHPSFSVDGILVHNSSILKSYTGKTKKELISKFRNTDYKLACTATPSPNDHMEILNHADFLDIMKSHEALAIWFINDTSQMGTYKLKGHAVRDFWRWVASWAVSISLPADLGYDNNGFVLPRLKTNRHVLRLDLTEGAGDKLFRIPEMSATSYHREKRITARERAQTCADIVNSTDEIYCVWCETNYEADELKRAIPEATEVRGSHSNKTKEQVAMDFVDGKIRVLIAKPSIFGFGMNFQICHRVVFCGLSYSFEMYYQAMRRFWRFGQVRPVTVDIVVGENEKNIIDVINHKEHEFESLKRNMLIAMREFTEIGKQKRRQYHMDYERDEYEADDFKLILGDAVEETKRLETESVHFQIFSPPFSQLYIYSDSYRDMGNCKSDDEFFGHFEFLIPELYRILKPGRLCAVHCKQLVNYKNRDGASGLRDFRGDIIRAFIECGYVYHSEVCIWKDPVIEMQRTKSHGLLYKQLRKDSSYSRQGLPEYLVIFRKWGEDVEPVNWKTKDNFELEKWQEYASPIWMNIRQTNVLNIKYRDNRDEKHICPLQLDVIERAIELWTNPGDVVMSPFAGIGSEGFVAVKLKRRFVGIELKEEYYNQAASNIKSIAGKEQVNLFKNAE